MTRTTLKQRVRGVSTQDASTLTQRRSCFNNAHTTNAACSHNVLQQDSSLLLNAATRPRRAARPTDQALLVLRVAKRGMTTNTVQPLQQGWMHTLCAGR